MDKKNITLNMRFTDIKVSKYLQYDLQIDFDNEKKPLVQFQSNFNFQVLEDTEKISCLIDVKILILETEEVFAELKVENIFEIKPFTDIIKPNSNKNGFNIPDAILINLVSISISTVRGILSEKLKGTIVQNEIFPLIDPLSIFKKTK